jgi:hypothetical protein
MRIHTRIHTYIHTYIHTILWVPKVRYVFSAGTISSLLNSSINTSVLATLLPRGWWCITCIQFQYAMICNDKWHEMGHQMKCIRWIHWYKYTNIHTLPMATYIAYIACDEACMWWEGRNYAHCSLLIERTRQMPTANANNNHIASSHHITSQAISCLIHFVTLRYTLYTSLH